MRKTFLMMSVVLASVCAHAQKTRTVETTTAQSKTNYQFTQARMPQVLVEPLVKPLVVEVEVIPTAQTKHKNFYKLPLRKLQVEKDLDGKLENIHNYGVFRYAQEEDCDMIVGATYNFYTNPKATNDESDDYYVLEIKGFPAKFKNWHTATTADYEWMKIRHEGANNPVIKTTK